MKTLVHTGHDMFQFNWTNSTGTAVTAGQAVPACGGWAVASVDIANGATGLVERGCEVTLPKQAAGFACSVDQHLGYDTANKRVTTDTSGGVVMVVTKAALIGDTSVTGVVPLGSSRQMYSWRGNPTAGEDTANSMTKDTGWGVAPAGPVIVQLQNSSGVQRVCTVTLGSGGSAGQITIAEASLAATDVVNIIAYRGGA